MSLADRKVIAVWKLFRPDRVFSLGPAVCNISIRLIKMNRAQVEEQDAVRLQMRVLRQLRHHQSGVMHEVESRAR
jgi:hypothetical protein